MRLTALRSVPDLARGFVRDLPVRWAFEEAGLPYAVELVSSEQLDSEAYRRDRQPFGQVPALRDGDLTLFESGAIVVYIGERSPTLLPADPAGRARAVTWVLAALNSVEPRTQALDLIDVFYAGEAWATLRRPQAEHLARLRLTKLAGWLAGRTWLEDRFTAGDLVMACVLRALHCDLVRADPVLQPYLERCLARPAFARALAAQLADLDRHAAPG
jgi:glutathione S-transferase